MLRQKSSQFPCWLSGTGNSTIITSGALPRKREESGKKHPLIWLITYSLLPSPPPLPNMRYTRLIDTPKIFTWTRHFLHGDMEINTEGHAWDIWLRNVDCVTERTDDALVNMYSSKTNDDFFKLRSFWCSLLYLILTMTLAVKWNDSAPDHDEVGYTAVGTVRFYVFSFIIGSLSWNLLKVT